MVGADNAPYVKDISAQYFVLYIKKNNNIPNFNAAARRVISRGKTKKKNQKNTERCIIIAVRRKPKIKFHFAERCCTSSATTRTALNNNAPVSDIIWCVYIRYANVEKCIREESPRNHRIPEVPRFVLYRSLIRSRRYII